MSPLPRVGRRATAILAVSMLLVIGFLAAIGAPAQGQAAAAKPFSITLSPQEDNSKCPGGQGPCWDVQHIVAPAGSPVNVTIDLSAAGQPHDFHVKTADGEKKVPDKAAIGGTYNLQFDMPSAADTKISYFCAVHPKTMFGTIITDAGVGATETAEIPTLGVHFLAYWVGVIAFALLFIVYGITFFIFKYNETSATTDQWDRSGADADGAARGKRVAMGANVILVAVTIAAVVAAGVIILALRGNISNLNDHIAALNAQVSDLTKQLAAAKKG